MHDVAVGDNIRFSLEPHLAGLLRAGFAAEPHVILVRDGLGADKAPLEIRMDDGGGEMEAVFKEASASCLFSSGA